MGKMLKDRVQEAMDRQSPALTVADLIRATGLSKSAIHFILNGTTKAETIRAVNIDKLAEALSVPRDWLLYGHEGVVKVRVESQPERLDPAKLPEAHQWMRIALGVAGVPGIPLEDDLPMLAEAYNFAAACGWDTRKAKWEELRAAIKRRARQGVNDGEGNTGRDKAG